MIKLNLGCGKKFLDGYVNVDIKKMKGVDVVCNLSKIPYPFKDNYVDGIFIDNALEHLEDIIKVMEEIHRICKNGAKIKIIAPYFMSSGAFQDPTHRQFFTSKTFNCFSEDSQHSYYSKAKFKINEVWIKFTRKSWIFDRLINAVMNLKPLVWLNERLYPLAFPMQEIEYELEVIK